MSDADIQEPELRNRILGNDVSETGIKVIAFFAIICAAITANDSWQESSQILNHSSSVFSQIVSWLLWLFTVIPTGLAIVSGAVAEVALLLALADKLKGYDNKAVTGLYIYSGILLLMSIVGAIASGTNDNEMSDDELVMLVGALLGLIIVGILLLTVIMCVYIGLRLIKHTPYDKLGYCFIVISILGAIVSVVSMGFSEFSLGDKVCSLITVGLDCLFLCYLTTALVPVSRDFQYFFFLPLFLLGIATVTFANTHSDETSHPHYMYEGVDTSDSDSNFDDDYDNAIDDIDDAVDAIGNAIDDMDDDYDTDTW